MTTATKPTAYSYIRFSTPEQLKGDSLRRQIELSEVYAEKHGLNLDKSLSIKDLGISAFDSSNISRGELGVFLQAVKDKKIPVGSYLLIESLDRLSRAQVLTALNIFISILEEGIVICTLTDGMQYSKQSVGQNFSELLISLTIMSRAHEESRMKSIRLSAAWKEKRKGLATKKFSAQCPYWMTLDKQNNKFELNQVHVDVVNYIFELAASGMGNYSIVKRLNSEGVKNFGRADSWSTSSVQVLLNNRSVLGEFQPHTKVNKKRVPDGEPVKDYFPAVVSEELFYRVKELRKGKVLKNSAGAKGATYSNLFSGFCKCAYCGGPMNYYNKGGKRSTSARWKYLVCINGKNGLGCDTTHVQYSNFEESFIEDLSGLDLSKILGKSDATNLARLQSEYGAICGQLEDVEKKLKRVADVMMDSDVPRTFKAKLSELEVLQDDLAAKKKSKESEISVLSTVHHTAESRSAELKAISTAMINSTGSDLYELRSRLVQAIRAIVQDIYLYPVGDPQKNVAFPFYMIEFKNGGIRYVKMKREGEVKRVTIMLEKVTPPLKVNKFKGTKSVSEILRHK
jgi:DNA invertase Pin-like site-specific DNA recombinase